jgi:hypothetical protein
VAHVFTTGLIECCSVVVKSSVEVFAVVEVLFLTIINFQVDEAALLIIVASVDTVVFFAFGEHFIHVTAIIHLASVALIGVVGSVPTIVVNNFPELIAREFTSAILSGGLNSAGGFEGAVVVALKDPAVVKFIIGV